MGQAVLDLPGLEKQTQKPSTEGTGGFVPRRGSDKPECSRSRNSWTSSGLSCHEECGPQWSLWFLKRRCKFNSFWIKFSNFLTFEKKFIARKKKKSHLWARHCPRQLVCNLNLGCTATDGNFYLCLGEREKKKRTPILNHKKLQTHLPARGPTPFFSSLKYFLRKTLIVLGHEPLLSPSSDIVWKGQVDFLNSFL